jgi:hypothetical protein
METKSQAYLKRQDEYVESLNKKGKKPFSLIDPRAFVKSMRKSGYKSTATAIDDLLDNSIEALASRIDIIYTVELINTKKIISNIAVIDNGLGMSPKMIEAAVLWGGTDRHNNRDGFGRFGFGLPSAAISMTNNYEVFSKRKEGKLHSVDVNIENIINLELKNEDITKSLTAVEKEFPDFIKQYLAEEELEFDQGSIILIKKPDSLTTGYWTEQSFYRNMMEHIGIVYRNYLRDCEIYLNRKLVLATDPLFLSSGARFYDIKNNIFAEKTGEQEIIVSNENGKEGKIRLRFAKIPFADGPGEDEKSRYKILKNYTHNYLIVCRGGRHIDVATSTHFTKGTNYSAPQTYDRNWAIELDFEPILDEEFGITVNKQQVNISEKIWDILTQNNINTIISQLKTWSNNWHHDGKLKRQKKDGLKISEDIAREAEEEGIIKKASELSPEKEEQAKKKLIEDAKEISDKTDTPVEEAVKKIEDKVKKQPFIVEFEAREGAPFYWVEQYGPQIKLFMNTRHRFFSDFYLTLDNERIKTVVELILIVLGTCEIQSTGKKELFYQSERNEWSIRLNSYLALLNDKDNIGDAEDAEPEELLKEDRAEDN